MSGLAEHLRKIGVLFRRRVPDTQGYRLNEMTGQIERAMVVSRADKVKGDDASDQSDSFKPFITDLATDMLSKFDELGSDTDNHFITSNDNTVTFTRANGKIDLSVPGGGSQSTYNIPIISGFDVPSWDHQVGADTNLGGTRLVRYSVTHPENITGNLVLQVKKNAGNWGDVPGVTGNMTPTLRSVTLTIPEDDIPSGETWEYRLKGTDTQDTPVDHYSNVYSVSVRAAPGSHELAYYGAQMGVDFSSYDPNDATGSEDLRTGGQPVEFDAVSDVPGNQSYYILFPSSKTIEIRKGSNLVTNAFTLIANAVTINSVQYSARYLTNRNSFTTNANYHITIR